MLLADKLLKCCSSGTGSKIYSQTVFNSGNTSSFVVKKLSDTKYLAFYKNSSSVPYLVVLELSGTTITCGSAVYVGLSTDYNHVFAVLSDTKVVLFYLAGADGNKGYAVVVSISGTTITKGTAIDVANGSFGIGYPAIATLSSTQVIVCYSDNISNSYQGYAQVLTISGTTITRNTAYKFNTDSTYERSITSLSTTKAIICFSGTSNRYLYAKALNISGTTLSSGSSILTIDDTVYVQSIDTEKISSTQIFFTYRNYTWGVNDQIKAGVLTISGSSLSKGSLFIVKEGSDTGYPYSTLVTDTKAVVCSYNDTDPWYGVLRVLNISGSTLTAEDELTFNEDRTGSMDCCRISDNRILVVYRDGTSLYYGVAQVIGI